MNTPDGNPYAGAPPARKAHSVGSVAMAALESLRSYQWLKNLLVFVPLLGAHRIAEPQPLEAALRIFIAFCLCSSSIYLLNDLHDVAADRLHPHKRRRAIASGRMPRGLAIALVPVLLAAAVGMALPLGYPSLLVVAVYFVLMIAYTLRLKAIILLDAFVLAAGYALRIFAGSLAVGISPSPRLLAFCIFLFVSLAMIKRYAELALLRLRDGPEAHARAYRFEDQDFILVLGLSCGTLSVLVLALYMTSIEASQLYSRSQLIWLTCTLLLYWISHLWLAAHRGRMTDDPLVFAIKDRISLSLIALMGISAWLSV